MIAASAAAIAATIAPVAANAQMMGETTVYGTAGLSRSGADGADLGAVQGRIGARFGQYFGVEGEAATGIDKDHTYINGVKVGADLNHQIAGYAVGYVPVQPNLDLFARVGYGNTEIKSSVAGISTEADGDSWNYGAGAQYFFDEKNGVRVDYTRHDFKNDGGKADVASVAYVRKF
ncbi:porin family protein [Caulobacter sp. NIBR2454]|uniref:porin family protein n=1 Tax=Caulobacter sp. NIBR2454 TaxID=3015996 RepID=UPI0022B664CB|nr:porin family protein [Caulobacter sp. NIBR2454]